MPIDIHIRLEPGESLANLLRSHGLLHTAMDFVDGRGFERGPHAASHTFTPAEQATMWRNPNYVSSYAGEPPVAEQTFGPLPETEAPAPAATEPPKRGRPRKATETAAPVPEVRYTVRRFGGDAESVHTDAQAAADRLLELIAEAGDPAALEELMQHNEAMVASLPDAVASGVHTATHAEMERLAPEAPLPEEPAPANDPEPPTHPAWPIGENKQPLYSVTPNRQGARDGICAIVTGPEPKYGHAVGLALLGKHGVAKLRDITDDADPKHAAIATDAAALLGLPMEGLL